MEHNLAIPEGASKEERYRSVLSLLRALFEDESDEVANLANTAAVLREALNFFWVGFYRRTDDQLVLGPFQGPLACTRIDLGKGVCGACAQRGEPIIVPNVDEFPGHIACSSSSRSEIVLPLAVDGRVELVLDVDSDKLDDFDEVDLENLSQVMDLIDQRHYS